MLVVRSDANAVAVVAETNKQDEEEANLVDQQGQGCSCGATTGSSASTCHSSRGLGQNDGNQGVRLNILSDVSPADRQMGFFNMKENVRKGTRKREKRQKGKEAADQQGPDGQDGEVKKRKTSNVTARDKHGKSVCEHNRRWC